MKQVGALMVQRTRLVTDVYTMGKRVLKTDRGKYMGKSVLNNAYALLHVRFFRQNTHIFSGQSTATLNLTIPHHVLLCRLNAETPRMLRDLADKDPSLWLAADAASRTGRPLTKLQADMLACVYAAAQPDFDLALEYESRYKEEEHRYVRKLALAREAGKNLTKEVVDEDPPLEMEFFDDKVDKEVDPLLPQGPQQFDPKSHVTTKLSNSTS